MACLIKSIHCSLKKISTPILRQSSPNFHLFLPNYRGIAHFTKQFLPKITPKGRNKEKCNQLKCKGFPPCTHMKRDMQHKGQLQLVQSTVNELYSDEVLRHMHIFADWILQNVQNVCLDFAKYFTKSQYSERTLQWWGTQVHAYFLLTGFCKMCKMHNVCLDFVKYFTKSRFWKSLNFSSARRSQFCETFCKLQTLEIWNFVKYFAEFRLSKLWQCKLRLRITIQWQNTRKMI